MTVELKADTYEMPDGTQRVEIAYENQTLGFTPDTLSEYIQTLSAVRESLQPPVPIAVPIGQKINAQLDPRFFTEPNSMIDGSSLLLRHAGLGWLAFAIPLESLKTLHRLIGAQIDEAQKARPTNLN